jgi:hypothetical protein
VDVNRQEQMDPSTSDERRVNSTADHHYATGGAGLTELPIPSCARLEPSLELCLPPLWPGAFRDRGPSKCDLALSNTLPFPMFAGPPSNAPYSARPQCERSCMDRSHYPTNIELRQ